MQNFYTIIIIILGRLEGRETNNYENAPTNERESVRNTLLQLFKLQDSLINCNEIEDFIHILQEFDFASLPMMPTEEVGEFESKPFLVLSEVNKEDMEIKKYLNKFAKGTLSGESQLDLNNYWYSMRKVNSLRILWGFEKLKFNGKDLSLEDVRFLEKYTTWVSQYLVTGTRDVNSIINGMLDNIAGIFSKLVVNLQLQLNALRVNDILDSDKK